MKLEYLQHPNVRYPYPHILSLPMAEQLPSSMRGQIREQLEGFGPCYTGPVSTVMKTELVERFRWVMRDTCIAFKTSGDVMMAKMTLDL